MDAYLNALHTICQPIRATDYPRSLRPVHELLAALDNPHKQYPAVVVTGSVGKGTTSYQIANLLQKAGLKVGLYTSPHIHSFRERFTINGTRITQAQFTAGVAVMQAVIESIQQDYSTFEMATVLALLWFAQEQVDIAVLECGLGGRWDAVNVTPNVLAVITPIEGEHLQMLGGSLESIAWRKAGIIQPKGLCITCQQYQSVADVLRHEAKSIGATLRILDVRREDGASTIATTLAIGAIHHLIGRGLIPRPNGILKPDMPHLPGRGEHVTIAGHDVLIDGGHTALAAWNLRERISATPHTSTCIIAGMLADKTPRAFFEPLDVPGNHILLTTAPAHRALSPDALKKSAHLRHARIDLEPDLNAALKHIPAAPESLVVITGSLRMAAAAREACGLLSPEEMVEARATRAIFDGDDYLKKLDRL